MMIPIACKITNFSLYLCYIIVQELRKKGKNKRDQWTIQKEKHNINYL